MDVLVDLGITAAGAAMAFVMSMSEFELVKAGFWRASGSNRLTHDL